MIRSVVGAPQGNISDKTWTKVLYAQVRVNADKN